jgi:hypothetical protein
MKGMLGNQRQVLEVDATIRMLTSFSSSRSTRFDCQDGLYAAANGHYLSVDNHFVNWGPIDSNKSIRPRFIFTCYANTAKITLIEKSGWVLLERVNAGAIGWNAIFSRSK